MSINYATRKFLQLNSVLCCFEILLNLKVLFLMTLNWREIKKKPKQRHRHRLVEAKIITFFPLATSQIHARNLADRASEEDGEILGFSVICFLFRENCELMVSPVGYERDDDVSR